MLIPISEKIKIQALRTAEWNEEAVGAWKDVSVEERNVLEKYVKMFLNKLGEEDFPDEDKKILRKHAKGFVRFLKEIK